jgi:hypothetical protein
MMARPNSFPAQGTLEVAHISFSLFFLLFDCITVQSTGSSHLSSDSAL